jgi:hypothetical protein
MRKMREKRMRMKKEPRNPNQLQPRQLLNQNLLERSDWVDHRRINHLAGILLMIPRELRQREAEVEADLEEVVDDGKIEEDPHTSHNNLLTKKAT